ncbi:F-box/LRR-repeat protein 20 [Linum perenne]
MAEIKPAELPQECWELIANSLDQNQNFESFSLVSTQFLSVTDHLRRTLTITSRTAPSLSLLLRRFPNVREIKVREFHGDLNSLLCQISNSSLDLESLDISGQCYFPSEGLSLLANRMRNLKKLNCSRICGLQNSDLFVIGNSFPSVEDLDISFPQYNSRFNPNGSLDLQSFVAFVTDEGITDLSLKLRDLRRINISGNQFITDKSLSSLSFNCFSLREIALLNCDFITQTGIGLALRNAVNLTSVMLDGIGIPSLDSILKESFAYAKNLGALHLSNSFLSDEFLSLIADANLPLEELSISHCYNFTSVGVECLLHRYRYLVYLDLEGANFLTDDCMIELSYFLPKLTFINLGLCSKLTGITFFTLMNNCPLLEDVKMESTNIGVEELKELTAKKCKIKSLDLAGNNSLSDECLKRVASGCLDLEMLNLSYCPNITEDGVTEVLSKCSRLRHLEISRCVGITSLSINLDLPELEILKAQGSILDDEALGTIAERCQGILHLDLESCLSVSKQGVGRVVENCRRLREIILRCCENVDIHAVALMAFRRPSLRKIIPPHGNMFTDNQIKLFLRHGCSVSEIESQN